MAKTLKVAVIEPVGGHGGMDYYDFGLCSGLAEAGIDVVLHTSNEIVKPVNVGFEVRCSFVGIYGDSPAWLRGLRYLWGMTKALASTVIEGRRICHFHLFDPSVLSLINILFARGVGRTVVITAHDIESFAESRSVPLLGRLIYRLAHGIICHNRVSREQLFVKMKVAEEKVSIIPHGNYMHALGQLPSREHARKRLEIAGSSKVILFFGQIKSVKGLDLLLDSMPRLLEVHPDALLLIAGRPWKTDFSIFRRRIDELGLNASCKTHIRYVPHEDVPFYYCAADLVALPYRSIYQSGVVLMAMSYGKPVLVPDLPGMTEIIRDGDTGLVFCRDNLASLTTKLDQAFSDIESLERMAERGYRVIQDKFDWKVIGKKTVKLYASVCE